MSRSYKRVPYCGERKGKYSKRRANRAVRARKFTDTFSRRADYKKLYESWNICDYRQIYVTFAEFCAPETRWSMTPPNLRKARNDYEKLFVRK